jgi:hypothetical protein
MCAVDKYGARSTSRDLAATIAKAALTRQFTVAETCYVMLCYVMLCYVMLWCQFGHASRHLCVTERLAVCSSSLHISP